MMAQKITPYGELADEIRNKADSGEAIETDLATNQRIISRVTDGIYREPWAAFRELIANAYDADATNVVVETGAPHFDKVVVRDDGNGMSPDTLAYMLRNIGGTPEGDNAATMPCLAFEFIPPPAILHDPAGIAVAAPAPVAPQYSERALRVLEKVSSM